MTINQQNLCNSIITTVGNLSANCCNEDIVSTALAVANTFTDREYYVELACDLPDLSLGNVEIGSTIFVQELNTLVVAADTKWVGADGRVYRKDVSDTTLFLWGNNSDRQLADIGTTRYSSPHQEYCSATDWSAVQVGGCNSSAIKIDGTLWGWGRGIYYQNGTGGSNNNDCGIPLQEISGATNWCCAVIGYLFAGGLKTDGSMWTWGCDAGNTGVLAINSAGDPITSPTQEVSSATDWCDLSAGYFNFAMIKTDNTLWGVGHNGEGQLGVNSKIYYSSPVQEITSATDWCHVSSGIYATFAIKTNGTWWGFGDGICGQLAQNIIIDYSSPVQEISSATDWCQIDAGWRMAVALKTDGSLWGTGSNNDGKLATNDTINYSSPVQEVTSATDWSQVSSRINNAGSVVAAVKTNGTLWAWGCNICGAVGSNDTINYSSPVQEVSSATNWCQVSAVGHVAALKTIV